MVDQPLSRPVNKNINGFRFILKLNVKPRNVMKVDPNQLELPLDIKNNSDSTTGQP